MTPKMKEALADIATAGSEGVPRRGWHHGATIAALLRSGAIETVPGDSDMVRVSPLKTSADSAWVTAVQALPVTVIPGHTWRWFNPQGGQPVSTTCIQLMGPGSGLTPVATINRNNDGTWHAEGRVNGMSGGIAGGYQRALTVEECALAIAAHLAGPPDISDIHEAATQAAFEATLPEIHEACGRLIKDHCAYCDTCDCGCPVADTIASTDGGIHAECGKPFADHCTGCDECPRVAGPCWCATVVDAEDDGRPAADEPVTIVEGSTAPGFEIDFGSEVTQREVTRREAWSIVKRLEYAGVHVADRLGMVDEVMSGVASYPKTPDEWRHVERCGPAGRCSCPVSEVTAGYGERDPRHLKLTDADVAMLSRDSERHCTGRAAATAVTMADGTVAHRARCGCSRQWQTGYHYTAQDAWTVAESHGVAHRPEWGSMPPVLTVADVVTLMTPEEAVSRLHIRERRWSRRRKASKCGAKW